MKSTITILLFWGVVVCSLATGGALAEARGFSVDREAGLSICASMGSPCLQTHDSNIEIYGK